MDGGFLPDSLVAVFFIQKALFLVFLGFPGGIVQHGLQYGLVACEQVGLAHRIYVYSPAHHALCEAGFRAVDIVLRGFEVVAGGINLLQGFQYAFVVGGLPI